MSLLRLNSAPIVLIEDDESSNILPLLQELAPQDKSTLHLFCYEQPVCHWREVFKKHFNIQYHEDINPASLEKINDKCSIIIDSVIQMSLFLGWSKCLKTLKELSANSCVNKLILVLHKDCLPSTSKMKINLNHIANAVVTFDAVNPSTVHILMKKSGRVVKTYEMLSYNLKTAILQSTPIVIDKKVEAEPQKPSPGDLSTFKIEVDQTEKLEKYKLKLPYMSKINEGESKIIYEPDAVDDWDEEDPDEDLDI